MIRTIFTPNTNDVTLALPDNFLGKKIEVIAFVVEDTTTEVAPPKKLKNFDNIQIDTNTFTFNREEANER